VEIASEPDLRNVMMGILMMAMDVKEIVHQ
jgi:hypothetical protein